VGDYLSRTNALVRASFAAVAENYRRSRRHGDPAGLRAMLVAVEPSGAELALDVATGGGHTAAALAPFVSRVVAFDLLPEMLQQARALLSEGHIRNAPVVCGDVHALPFADGAFDLVTCRCAPHHFGDLVRACAEIARCLRRGGKLYINDCGSPADTVSGKWVNEVERLRDPSHVEALSARGWERALRGVGLEVVRVSELPNVYRVPEWLDHLDAPSALRSAVLRKLAEPPPGLDPSLAVDLTPGRETFTTLRVEALAVRPG
jgi:ubiquinone/menaquinone biosynthesis C-methylase UbiE